MIRPSKPLEDGKANKIKIKNLSEKFAGGLSSIKRWSNDHFVTSEIITEVASVLVEEVFNQI